MLRARVSYGTSATKKAKYGTTKKKPAYHPIISSFITKAIPIIDVDAPVLLHGDYVVIDELMNLYRKNIKQFCCFNTFEIKNL